MCAWKAGRARQRVTRRGRAVYRKERATDVRPPRQQKRRRDNRARSSRNKRKSKGRGDLSATGRGGRVALLSAREIKTKGRYRCNRGSSAATGAKQHPPPNIIYTADFLAIPGVFINYSGCDRAPPPWTTICTMSSATTSGQS